MNVRRFFDDKVWRVVTKSRDIVVGTSYVIQFVEDVYIHHEGDERSRTHPGHGYPAYTEEQTAIEQIVTLDKAAWEETIRLLTLADAPSCDFAAFIVHRPVVEKSVSIKIDSQEGGKDNVNV